MKKNEWRTRDLWDTFKCTNKDDGNPRKDRTKWTEKISEVVRQKNSQI